MLRVFATFVLLFLFLQSKSQLIASTQQVSIGNVSKNESTTIEIPILNQSKNTLTFYSLNSNGQGMQTLPVEIASYEKAFIRINAGYKSKKINQQLVFENKEGRVIVALKGKIKRNTADADCYDFSKPNIKVNTKSAYVKNETQTELLRIYSKNGMNSLFSSNPQLVPEAHLTILLDASGSMGTLSKLDEMKEKLIALVEQLRPNDCLSILRYSDTTDLILSKTKCSNMALIKEKIKSIEAGGFTNGMQGIKTSVAYLRSQQKAGYSNNLIMLTDGDFNFGSDQEEIRRYLVGQLISLNYRFSVITVQSDRGNSKQMKELANAGKGHYFKLDQSIDVELLNQLLIKQLAS